MGHRPELYESWMAGRNIEVTDFKYSYGDEEENEKQANDDA